MKIAINTKFLADPNLEGFARFTYEIAKRLVETHPEDQFYFLFDRKYSSSFIFGTNEKPIIVHPQARHPILWYIWYEYSSRRVLNKIKPDVYLSPDGLNTLNLNLPNATVIHDIGFARMEHQIPFLAEKYWRWRTPQVIRSSSKIITVSEFSKKEIIENYPHAKGKVEVVYNGFTHNFKPISQEEKQIIKDEYSNGQDYLLYVGSIHPRKNVGNLVRAFEKYKANHSSSVKLVLAGRWAWKSEETKKLMENSPVKNDIISTGYISEEQLSRLMSAARGFCYISLYEGFGIPILEAMAAGTPVMTSNVSSMPEVAGDAALLVDPKNVDEIALKMEQLIQDDVLRSKLIEKGHKRLDHFNWDRSAEKVYQILTALHREHQKN